MYVGGSDFSKWAISQGVASKIGTNFYGDTCDNLWLTEDGMRMFTACGSVYRTSTVPSEDLQPNGSLSDLRSVVWADEASSPGLTAILASQNSSGKGAEELRIYEDAFLQLKRTLLMRPFPVGNANYPAYGKFVFWNAAERNIIVVENVDAAAGLLSGYGVAVIKLYGADFDADGKGDISIWRPNTGVWYVLPSGSPGKYRAIQWEWILTSRYRVIMTGMGLLILQCGGQVLEFGTHYPADHRGFTPTSRGTCLR